MRHTGFRKKRNISNKANCIFSGECTSLVREEKLPQTQFPVVLLAVAVGHWTRSKNQCSSEWYMSRRKKIWSVLHYGLRINRSYSFHAACWACPIIVCAKLAKYFPAGPSLSLLLQLVCRFRILLLLHRAFLLCRCLGGPVTSENSVYAHTWAIELSTGLLSGMLPRRTVHDNQVNISAVTMQHNVRAQILLRCFQALSPSLTGAKQVQKNCTPPGVLECARRGCWRLIVLWVSCAFWGVV